MWFYRFTNRKSSISLKKIEILFTEVDVSKKESSLTKVDNEQRSEDVLQGLQGCGKGSECV